MAILEHCHEFLIPGDASPLHAEDVEEVVVEALGLALFVGGVFPVACERCSASADLVPGESHGFPVTSSILALVVALVGYLGCRAVGILQRFGWV